MMVSVYSNLTEIRCTRCDILYAMPDTFGQMRTRDGATFYCPNGHQQAFATQDTDAEKLKKASAELARERQQHDQTRARARDAENALLNAKTKAAKLRKRAKDGKCPCCQEQFKNLETHMQDKHPGYGVKKKPALV